MNRTEALRILGLDDDATPEDVKTAYKETVQILHPDRFASTKIARLSSSRTSKKHTTT